LPFVRLGLLSPYELPAFEFPQDSAHISGVQTKLLADVSGRSLLAVRQFIQHSSLGKGEGAAGHSIHDPDLAGIEAVKCADRAHLCVNCKFRHRYPYKLIVAHI